MGERLKVTIRQDDPAIDLRGYVDTPTAVVKIAVALRDAQPGVVLTADHAPDDFNPFDDNDRP